jgi:hypothetical protein
MKKNNIPFGVTLVIFTVIANSSFSQANIINRTLVSPDSSVLFVGMPNSIEVVNYKNPFFEIRAANSILRATGNSFVYEIHPTKLGWDTIFVMDDGNVLFKKAFRIDPLPPVQVKLGTLATDLEEATQEEIVINSWLQLFIPNCKCTTSFAVTSFEVSFEGEDVSDKPIKIEGDRLTIPVRKMIMALKSGDTVSFDHIIAKNPDEKTIEVPGVSIGVK